MVSFTSLGRDELMAQHERQQENYAALRAKKHAAGNLPTTRLRSSRTQWRAVMHCRRSIVSIACAGYVAKEVRRVASGQAGFFVKR